MQHVGIKCSIKYKSNTSYESTEIETAILNKYLLIALTQSILVTLSQLCLQRG